jgi:solute carrier family 25 protein 44
MSVATFVPSSAVWWSAYGVYQQVLSHLYLRTDGSHAQQQQPASPQPTQHDTGEEKSLNRKEVLGVQLASALLAGGTASLITNPLDLIKTRIQVGRPRATVLHTILWQQDMFREHGVHCTAFRLPCSDKSFWC